jgi:hypothetical protein
MQRMDPMRPRYNYANLFPSRVRALVVDGVVHPVAWTTGYGEDAVSTPVGTRIGSADGSERTLDEFFRLCDAAGPDCALSGNASGRYAALAERLRGHPVDMTDPVTGEAFAVTYNDLIAVTVGVPYAPFIWPDFAPLLVDLEQQLSPPELGRRLAVIRTELGLDAAVQEPYPNVVEASPASSVPTASTRGPSRPGSRPPTAPRPGTAVSAGYGT